MVLSGISKYFDAEVISLSPFPVSRITQVEFESIFCFCFINIIDISSGFDRSWILHCSYAYH